jgi:hypothetical protein
MGEKPVEIEHEIEYRRERLGRNIRNLQERVGEMTDWRKQYKRRPLAFLGAAFGAGLAVSLVVGNGHSHAGFSAGGGQANSVIKQRTSQAWQDMKSALIGAAAARLTEIVSEAIPGFRDQYRRSERRHSATYVL